MTVHIIASATEEATSRMLDGGPRRDFVELAKSTGARIHYASGQRPTGLMGRLFGPHVRQAWRVAGEVANGDVVFADGEHTGLPLVVALRLRRKRNRVVMLGHFVSKRWKSRLIRLASYLERDVTLVLHSVVQERAARRATGDRWTVLLVPYQVDADFWTRGECSRPPETHIVAVGAEHRDYETLINAVRGTDLRVTIAAGSHWARVESATDELPPNVTVFREPLGFADLRELYRSATVAVVPLENVPNQSGITVMLEAMAMGLPLIVTASQGQRECVTGPLVRATGAASAPMAQRGAALFGLRGHAPDGLYVPPQDAMALRTAIELLASDASFADAVGRNGRETVLGGLTLDHYVQRLSALLVDGGDAR